MNISDTVIKKYGRSIKLCNSDGTVIQSIKCIIQPLRYKNKMYTQGTPTDIGLAQAGYYLMIAPACFSIANADEGCYISDNEKIYHPDRSETVYFGNKVIYIWTILREKSEGNYPVYNHFS